MLEMKNEKKLHGFSFSINMANFEAFPLEQKVETKPLFSEEWYAIRGETEPAKYDAI